MLKNSVCNFIKKLTEHGIHCLPCCHTNDVIGLLTQQLRVNFDEKVTSWTCYSSKVLSTTGNYSIGAIVTDL